MPSKIQHLPPGLHPRLLSVNQAAEYCGVGRAKFKECCPIEPVDKFGRKLYDIRDLDAVIDTWTGKLPMPIPGDGISRAEQEALRRACAD